MPILMDRHDVRAMTAASVAEAHRKDLAIEDKYNVGYITSAAAPASAWSMRRMPQPPSKSIAGRMLMETIEE